MKIGDKVRFLSETGGGRISGFQGKNIVLVEDEDGFEIPTPVNDVVVVKDDDYSSSHFVNALKASEGGKSDSADNRSIRQRLADTGGDAEDYSVPTASTEPDASEDPSVGFVEKPHERKDGDKLSVFVAFVPQDIKKIPNTKYEAYIVNDSNYFVAYTLLSAEGNNWTLRSAGEIEPNTKVYLGDLAAEQLNGIEHSAVQLLAYKRDKAFLLKPTIDVQLRIDATKFFKLHAFADNDFFDSEALLFNVVENDKAARPLVVDADELKKEMYAPAKPKAGDTMPAREGGKPKDSRQQGGKLVRRYDGDQSKSRKVKQVLRDDKIVINLHADQLLDTTAGMGSADILEYQLDVFRKTLDQYKDNKGQKLIFIHGKGEGVLRHALIHELNYRYKKYPYQDASFQEYGYGATQVTIR